MSAATAAQVMKYFGMPIAEFKREWMALSDNDKDDLRQGIGDGTLTYPARNAQ